MKVKVVYELEFGDTRCSARQGERCQFLGATSFGTRPVCMFFRDPQTRHGYTNLFEDDDNCALRCRDCRRALAQDGKTYVVQPGTFDVVADPDSKE